MKIKVGNTYRNRNGREVYIEAKMTYTGPASHPYIGSYPDNRGYDHFNENGELRVGARDHGGDLLPNTVKKEGWINIYGASPGALRTPSSAIHLTKETAIRAAAEGTIATIRIEWEEEE